ncbi:MAG: methyltransferase [Pseudomonadota bacterium]
MPLRALRLQLLNLRNHLLASPRFRRAASAFWPTQRIARARARDVFDLVAGFTYSQTLFACIELGLLALLRRGPRTIRALSDALSLDEDATRALAEAATALRLLQSTGDDEYGLGVLGAAVVDDQAVQNMVTHHAHFYRDMADPIGLLKARRHDTELAAYWPYAEGNDVAMDEEAVARYTALMSSSQPMIYEQVHAAFRINNHHHLLDVGGGNGAFVVSAAQIAPSLKLSLFDMPPVAKLAEQHLAAEGLSSRVTVHGGDFTRDALPEGADLISLVRILHDHDDDVVQALLANVYRALPARGRVLIAEPLAATAGAPRMGSVYFTFYLRAMGSGRPRRFDELAGRLKAAGFIAVHQEKTPIPMLASVIHAVKPG